MNRFLDPYGTLGPARRDVMVGLITLPALLLVFAWIALAGHGEVIGAMVIFYAGRPNILGPRIAADLAIPKIEAEALPKATRNRMLILFIALVLIAIVLDWAVAARHGVPPQAGYHEHTMSEWWRPKGEWPIAIFVLLAPLPPLVYYARWFSRRAWRAKISSEVQP